METIESVAAPSLAQHLLETALADSGLEALPEGRVQLQRFVSGPLKDAIARGLGGDDAEFIEETLEGILPRIVDPSEQSQIRLTARPTASQEMEAESSADPAVLGAVIVSSAHAERRQGLLDALEPHFLPLRADDLMSLFDQVQSSVMKHPVVVLDCMAPAVNPISVATLVPDLPQGSCVVLWGATEQLEDELVALGQGQGRFIRCEGGVSASDVAMLVRALQGT